MSCGIQLLDLATGAAAAVGVVVVVAGGEVGEVMDAPGLRLDDGPTHAGPGLGLEIAWGQDVKGYEVGLGKERYDIDSMKCDQRVR